MASPEKLANVSLTIACHEIAEMRARVLDAAAGNHEVVRKAADIVKGSDVTATGPSPEHLALELLAAVYKEVIERDRVGPSDARDGGRTTVPIE